MKAIQYITDDIILMCVYTTVQKMKGIAKRNTHEYSRR